MFLITSAGYLSPEFISHFGQLPPAFLPLANRRLYEFQIEAAKQVSDDIVLSLPADYPVPHLDRNQLEALGVRLLQVPPRLSLGASVVYCVNVCMVSDEPLQILHGDTLFDNQLPLLPDCMLVGEAVDFYPWGRVRLDANQRVLAADDELLQFDTQVVMAGYFNFARPRHLIAAISRSGFDFVDGIEDYSRDQPLTAQRSEDWLDFGHLTAYYKSKARHTTERAFNTLRTSRAILSKTSEDHDKIRAEASWFENLPKPLQTYTPKYFGQSKAEDTASYDLEYLYLSTLSDLYTFGALPNNVWGVILASCDMFLKIARGFDSADFPDLEQSFSQSQYTDKLLQRLHRFCEEVGFDRTTKLEFNGQGLPPLDTLVAEICPAIPDASPDDLGVWHGDLHFSNIFYDFRSQQIKLIDPRGRDFEGRRTHYGDCRYDIAKLYHSVVGRYDAILAGRYTLNWDGRHKFDLSVPVSAQHELVEASVLGRTFGGYDRTDWALPMTISLFLSMLPLHYENRDRQMALLANALRLYTVWKG